jgi:hypothetical protein
MLHERQNRETPSPSRRTPVNDSSSSPKTNATPSQASSENEKRWFLRFQELETRLKAEQEGRALDQKGAKLRLDEVRKENAELRNEIKEKEAASVGSSSGSTKSVNEHVRDTDGV